MPTVISDSLMALSPNQIKDYQLTDFSDDEIKGALSLLDPGNLSKVLLNMPKQDLITIEDRITPESFNNTINKIVEPDRLVLSSRLNS